jgi:hypothetical protein
MIAEWRKRWRAGVIRRRRAYIMARYAEELHRNLRAVAMPMEFQKEHSPSTYDQAQLGATRLARMLLTRLDFELRAAECDKRAIRVKVSI